MFNLFRSREKSVRYMLGAILVVISLSMLVYLIPGGPGRASAANENVVATVGGSKITVNDVQQTIDRMVGNQPGVPRALLATYAPTIVNQMVEMYAKAYKAKQLGLSVSDDELATYIQRMVSQQAGGHFDKATYAALVEQRGFTVPRFEDFLRVSLLASRYDTVASNALVVTDDEARREYERENEKVSLQYIQFSQKDFTNKVNTESHGCEGLVRQEPFAVPDTGKAQLRPNRGERCGFCAVGERERCRPSQAIPGKYRFIQHSGTRGGTPYSDQDDGCAKG